MIYTVQGDYPYWITLGLAFVAGGVLVRIFILFHDCCHGSFFVSRRANSILGFVTGVLTFTPFEDWRLAHNSHHATAADLDRRGVGDVWTMTVKSILRRHDESASPTGFTGIPLSCLGRGRCCSFCFAIDFLLKARGKGSAGACFTPICRLLFIVGIATWTIGFWTYLLVQLPVILIAGTLGLWLFYLQHQFEDVYWIRHDLGIR